MPCVIFSSVLLPCDGFLGLYCLLARAGIICWKVRVRVRSNRCVRITFSLIEFVVSQDKQKTQRCTCRASNTQIHSRIGTRFQCDTKIKYCSWIYVKRWAQKVTHKTKKKQVICVYEQWQTQQIKLVLFYGYLFVVYNVYILMF